MYNLPTVTTHRHKRRTLDAVLGSETMTRPCFGHRNLCFSTLQIVVLIDHKCRHTRGMIFYQLNRFKRLIDIFAENKNWYEDVMETIDTFYCECSRLVPPWIHTSTPPRRFPVCLVDSRRPHVIPPHRHPFSEPAKTQRKTLCRSLLSLNTPWMSPLLTKQLK